MAVRNPMTVRELIAALQALPADSQDDVIEFLCPDGASDCVREVSVTKNGVELCGYAAWRADQEKAVAR